MSADQMVLGALCVAAELDGLVAHLSKIVDESDPKLALDSPLLMTFITR